MAAQKIDPALVRLKRVSDLFVEGKELVLQEDPLIMVWVNKLNSFEEDEARRDGLAWRSISQLQIERSGDEHSAIAGYIAEFESDDKEGKAKKTADLFSQEDLITAMNEIDSIEEWQGKGDLIRRGEMISEGDDLEAQKEVLEQTANYFAAIQEQLSKLNAERVAEYFSMPDEELKKLFRKKVSDVVTLDEFVRERDISMIFFSLRNCNATAKGDHSRCKHERLLEDRDDVRDLPDGLIKAVKETLDNIDVNPREAGNSDAPTPSSEPSEQPSEQEESRPSIRKVTSSVSLPA